MCCGDLHYAFVQFPIVIIKNKNDLLNSDWIIYKNINFNSL